MDEVESKEFEMEGMGLDCSIFKGIGRRLSLIQKFSRIKSNESQKIISLSYWEAFGLSRLSLFRRKCTIFVAQEERPVSL